MYRYIRPILNTLLTAVVLFVLKFNFTELVHINSYKVLYRVLIIYELVDIIITIIIEIIGHIARKFGIVLWKKSTRVFVTIIKYIVVIWTIPIKLYFINEYYKGFSIANSLILYAILTLVLCPFAVPTSMEEK